VVAGASVDDGGTAAGGDDTSDPVVFEISINSAPTLVVATGSTCDTTGAVASADLAVVVADLDDALADVSLVATSSNDGLVPLANVTFSGVGAARTVEIEVAAGQSGTSSPSGRPTATPRARC
jgi:hypothetical protein